MSLALYRVFGAVPPWRTHDSDDDRALHDSGVGAGLVSDGPRAGQEGIDAEAAARVVDEDLVAEDHESLVAKDHASLVAEDDEGLVAKDDERRGKDDEGRA